MRAGRSNALSDTGRRRIQNEDTYVCAAPLFAVADGMGGAQAGEVASRIATTVFEERLPTLRGEDAVAAMVMEANERIYRHALHNPAVAGMGTTVTALLVDEGAGTIVIGHVGDSRAYLFRDGVLTQLTEDHSLVAELVRTGRLTPEDAEQHPHRSVITRAVGTEPSVEVDVRTIPAEPGDLYVICSDGLTDMLRDTEIADAVADAAGEPSAVTEALVSAANRAGGIDNVTVVAFEIVDGDREPASERGSDEETAEHAGFQLAPVEPPGGAVDVQRHGPGGGGRWLALAAILLALGCALLLVWWGLGR